MPATTTLLSWNVAGRRAKLAAQGERVAATNADVVCLQEVTARTVRPWTELLAGAGLEHVASGEISVGARDRPLITLTAARRALEVVTVAGVPWSERVLAVRIDGLEVVNVHSPISSKPGLAKVLTHEAVRGHLERASGARLVCGDLNTPRKEHPDGRVWTFARTRAGRLRPERGSRWDEAELGLIKGLEPLGFRDAFRERHGLARRENSWEWQQSGGGYRLDHLIVSAEIAVDQCGYLHEWRRDGLSDHSPLLGTVAWGDR